MNPEVIRTNLLFLISLVLLFFSSCNGNSSSHSGKSGDAAPQQNDSAYEYIYNAMDRDFQAFSVYTDADAGGNHFAPSGYFNGTTSLIINTRWAENPYSGTSCIQVEWDGSPGNDGWSWNGLLFEEPQGYLGQLTGNGYGLIGATTLTFWARTDEPGLRVQFGMGHVNDASGEKKEWFILGLDWKKYEIDLRGLDLSNVHGGFLFVVNNDNDPAPDGTVFYIDEIAYDLARPNSLRLLPSFSAVTDTDAFDVENKNLATIYDGALAILALLERDTDADLSRAMILADALVFARENDNSVVPADWPFAPPPFSGSRLKDGYSTGDLQDAQGNFRYPGWWDDDENMWKMHDLTLSYRTGDLAWVMIALTRLYEVIGKQSYLLTAEDMGEWIVSNCQRTGSGINGGYKGGWVWSWEQLAWQESGVSTEHNIDLAAAYTKLYDFTGDEIWQERADSARSFVEAMWNTDQGYFYTGLNTDGTISVVKTLDVQAWAVMLFETEPYWNALYWAEENLSADGLHFDFNDDLDGTWYEGVAHMAAASKVEGNDEKAAALLELLRDEQSSNQYVEGQGIPGADVYGLTTGLSWNYYDRLSLGATCWFILAEEGVNPF
ncbi:MAG TPA: hypothetical protein PK874_10015 [Desulfobacteraceae bacterium]|nr:hypothetical protein [Desulfobacteraceae bacterium]HPJ67033.1 hypothetical protein [Desulfobacteraceae bacterium]HPQ27299.1 hypothetical protein [Desulfobacteraceae bacterium]